MIQKVSWGSCSLCRLPPACVVIRFKAVQCKALWHVLIKYYYVLRCCVPSFGGYGFTPYSTVYGTRDTRSSTQATVPHENSTRGGAHRVRVCKAVKRTLR